MGPGANRILAAKATLSYILAYQLTHALYGLRDSPYARLAVALIPCDETSFNRKFARIIGDGVEGGYVEPQFAILKTGHLPQYDIKSAGPHDIGYAVLERELNLPATAYTPLLTDKREIAELLVPEASSHLVGFGHRNDNGYGVKYEVATQIKSVTLDEAVIGGEGKDSCQGDSGGSVYGQLGSGEWRLYGVISRGGVCGEGGVVGLIHESISWIQRDSGISLNLPGDSCSACEKF
jgi:hypothetical protein